MDQSQSPIDQHMLRKLEAALASMPRKRRQIFLAKRLDNMTYAEIAGVTGLTERQVERQMAKALALLSKELDPARPSARAGLLHRLLRFRMKIFGGVSASQPSGNGQGASADR